MNLFINTFTIILLYLSSIAVLMLHILLFDGGIITNDIGQICLDGLLYALVPIIVMAAKTIKDLKK
ncbi:hypothetical protein DNU06_16875 [Putridiphycobacter roseus]|uniref:Uncharacterized protein n=1 Tax=Putridiphycobacter roseus TaxID=2219161 RepID=A0A2W1MX01_9FLAO|nr:hypothetical protein [Putridiphycobacter roseus]PZE15680.1 hypothetical protein DNU06_16875 [Putridiphycobacter roseus]